MSPHQAIDVCNAKRLIWRLLIVGAILPAVSDEIVALGHRLGAYSITSVGLLHVIVVSVLFMGIVIAEGLALRRGEAVRVDALRKVQASEARLRLQIARMPIACITFDRDFTITSWNPAAERIFGYPESEILGHSGIQLAANGMTPDLQSVWERLLDGDGSAHTTTENRTRDGRLIVCRWTNTPLIDDGTVVAVLSIVENITEETRAEEVLQQTRTRYCELLDQLPHFIFSADMEDRYTVANAATCRFLRREEADILGKTPEDLGVEPALAKLWREQKARTRASGKTETLDLSLATESGVHAFRAITSPVRDASGAIVGVSGISIDMTNLKAAEAVADRLLRAVEQLDEVVFTTDRDGIITYVNPAFTMVYGFSRAEAVGKTPRILKSGDQTSEQYKAFWSELLAGRSVRPEYRNRRKDGSLVDVIGTASPVVNSDGQISGFIAVQQDVTRQNREAEERRRFDEQVAHLAKMEALGTLAGGLAHDFNNILSIVLTHTSLLERKHDEPTVKRVLSTVQQAVQRGAAVARQILTFARRAELKPEAVDITQLIMELVSMISETFPRTVSVTMRLESDLPLVRADAGQIHQALLNLCVNARDAMPSGGNLVIEARKMPAGSMKGLRAEFQGEECVMIAVSDTGVGIDEETRKRIFEPFFTTKEKGKGTGLGLALVFGVANNHGGLVDVESRVGEGSTFRLYLPLPPCAATVADVQRFTDEGGSETLLLVEDEADLRDSIGAQLRLRGYQVRIAENGIAAIDACKREGIPEAVVMDLGMPKMTAIELLRALRDIAPALPIVAMTGYVDPEVHTSVVAAGVQQIVSKPFEIQELLAAIRAALQTR